jgi:hypothetical protein
MADIDGWKRGARGIDGAYDKDGKDFLRTFDKKADRNVYGPTYVGYYNVVTEDAWDDDGNCVKPK